MQKADSIVIVCVCDNHYAILLAALIKSIEVNHHTNENIDFYIVEDKISQANKVKVSGSISKSTLHIHWLAMKDCLPDKAKLPVDKSSLPLNIYTRLFIPQFIPKEVKKVIYLDVDMIVLEDISILWKIDLADNVVAAVQDQFIQVVSRWGGISNYKQLGIDAESKYFNSGLMVMDIEKWQALDVTNRVIECVSEHSKLTSFPDQYGLNVVLTNKWHQLDQLWNRFAYSEEERPFLIHFTGRKPIYKTYEFSEKYRELFYGYLALTAWKNFKPIGEAKRYFKKAGNFIEKFSNLFN